MHVCKMECRQIADSVNCREMHVCKMECRQIAYSISVEQCVCVCDGVLRDC